MSDTTIVAMPPAPPAASSYVAWGPVVGGALVACALSFVLFAFGSAAGVASVSPYSTNNPSITTLSIVSVAWVLVVMIGSFLAGGYISGRLRRPTGEGGRSEHELRDGAHGLLVWALGLVLGVTLGFMVAGATVRGAATVAAQAGGAAAGVAGSAAAANLSGDRINELADSMLRAAPRPGEAPTRGEDSRAEVVRIMTASLRRGDVSNEDRTYLAQVVAARAGIPEDEARRRVDATIDQAKQAMEQAKQAADKARKAAAILAFLLGAASLLAAGAAYWGATMGGQHRDEGMASV